MNLFYFSILSGILAGISWLPGSSGMFMFAAYVPLLFVEDSLYKNAAKKSSVFSYAFISFFFWNLISTWWIYFASPGGMAAAIIVNSLLFAFVFWLFHLVRRTAGNIIGYSSLVIFWITMEYIYLNGEISWPWLTLGNAFANDIRIVQWYEYTGILGGSLWILTINIFLFLLLKKLFCGNTFRQLVKLAAVLDIIIFVPIVISLFVYYNYEEKKDPREVVVVQPNIDPYKKFSGTDAFLQTSALISCADTHISAATDYVVMPETAVHNNVWLHELKSNFDLQRLRSIIEKYPGIKIVLGISGNKLYYKQETPTARRMFNGMYYDSYNSALQLDSTDNIQVYHKSKLVIGVEKMPYIQYLSFLEHITIDMGESFRGLGTQPQRSVFSDPDSNTFVAPVICYESIYGEFVSNYIKKGAGLIFIITNDGWWSNTPGHKQHCLYARLRAVETRRSIARSANTGISCFINQRGDIQQPLTWWKQGAVKASINVNNKITFYVKHGDYIGRAMMYCSILVLGLLLFLHIKKNKI